MSKQVMTSFLAPSVGIMLLNRRDDVIHFTGEPNVYNAGQNWSGNTYDMLINGVCLWKLHSCCRLASSLCERNRLL